MLMFIFVTALIALLFYYLFIKSNDYWEERGVPQAKPQWAFGESLKIIFKPSTFSDRIQYIYNNCPGARYLGFFRFSTPVLMVKDPDLLKQLTVKDFDHFTDRRSLVPEDSDPLWSNNVFALKGQKWRRMRLILSPSFTSSKMKAMFVLMEQCAENFVNHFLKKDEDVIVKEMKDIFTRFATDVIGTTAFGIEVNSLEDPKNEFYLMGKEVTEFTGLRYFKILTVLMFPKLTSVLKIQILSQKVRDFFINLVNRTIEIREERAIVRPDMINLLMEARKGHSKHEENGIADAGFATAQDFNIGKSNAPANITNEEIAAQAVIFFFGGYDTVSTLMSFTSYELAINPDIQGKLRDEVRATFEECGGKLTYEGLTKMKYMDMVVSEALRKWPSFLVIDRVCTKPCTIEPATPNGKPLYLEKGAQLSLPIYALHHDPQYFPDPERFDPERFSDENKANINPYSYFPFGLGPRNCIGSRFALLEAKIIFYHLLLHFQIVPVEKTPIPLEFVKRSPNLIVVGGIWLGLKRIRD